jgi:hypothetical protein
MVCCCDVTASSFVAKILGEVFTHFHAGAVKVTVVCEIDCLTCQDKFFMSSHINVTCIASFGLDEAGPFHHDGFYFASGS